MLNGPVSRVILKMAIPTIIAFLINSMYSLADTFFVSSLGTNATAAVSVNASLDQLIMMAGSMLAMGANSYIVKGNGNPESFLTSSHGAGRSYSRTGAMERFSVESVMLDLKERNVVLGKNSKKDVPEECRFAYKDIDTVMENQKELTAPIKKLFTVGVVKG